MKGRRLVVVRLIATVPVYLKRLRAISIMICQSIIVISLTAYTGERDKKQTA